MMKRIMLALLMFMCLSFASLATDCATHFTIDGMTFVPDEYYSSCTDINATSTLVNKMPYVYGTDNRADDYYSYSTYTSGANRMYSMSESGYTDAVAFGFYLEHLDFDNYTIRNYHGSQVGSCTRHLYLETEYDSVEVMDYGTTINYQLTTVKMSVYNSTHLLLETFGAGNQGNVYLQYSDGSSDSDWIRWKFVYEAGQPKTYVYFEGNNDTYTASSQVTGLTMEPFTSEYKSLWRPYTIYDGPLNSSISKVVSHFNTADSFLIDGLDDVQEPTLICKAYLYGNQEFIAPKLTFFPERNFTQAGWWVSAGYSYMMNDSSAYVLDQNNLWWFVPAFTCTGTSGVSTDSPSAIQAVYVGTRSQGLNGEIVGTLDVPPIAYRQLCQADSPANEYNLYVKYSEPANFTLVRKYCNGTYIPSNRTCSGGSWNITTNVSTSSEYNETIDTSEADLAEIIFYVNGNEQCIYRYGVATLLNLSQLSISGYTTELFYDIIFIILLVLSGYVPFMIIGAVWWNDVFRILNIEIMCFVVITTGFISTVINWNTKNKDLKTFIFFLAFAAILLARAYTVAGVDQPSALLELNDNMDTIYDIVSTADLTTFALGIPDIMIALGNILINTPSAVVTILAAIVNSISPELGQSLEGYLPIIVTGGFAYLILKLYEVLSNRQQGV